MNQEIINKINSVFSDKESKAAFLEIESITLESVMANSQENLDNTWLAILQLSDGDLEKLKSLVVAAKKDFRDVIYWAELDK